MKQNVELRRLYKCRICGKDLEARFMAKIRYNHNGENGYWNGVCRLCSGQLKDLEEDFE